VVRVLDVLCGALEHASELVEINLSDNALGTKGVRACAKVRSRATPFLLATALFSPCI
jgi:Ran GTPase-activating protein (RanGAP) involved in mRNA processing and transport